MNRETKMAIKLNLQDIEDVLNSHQEWNEEYYDYNLTLHKDKLLFDISIEDEDLENFTIEIEENKTDVKSICKSLIKFIYDNEINYRSTYVKDSKNFNNRKIKSLVLWSSRDNIEKINKINSDLIEHYKTIQIYNMEISNFKSYVSDLYNALNKLCPTWKIEDISKYINERFIHLSIAGVECSIQDNKIIAIFDNRKFSVAIDNFSNRNEVFSELNGKIKSFKEVA